MPPEPDHCSMLRKVRCFPYEMPLSLSSPLALLITEVITQSAITKLTIWLHAQATTNHSIGRLQWYHDVRFPDQLLCKTPTRRLRTLDRFKRQTFFRGTTFDLALLQRQPVEVTNECPNVAGSVVPTKVRWWFFLSSLFRWYWSWERDRTELPKLGEASLCLCSLSKVSTTTPFSALRPRRTHSWMPTHEATQLRRSPAPRSPCSLLRKKAYVAKCLFDWRSTGYSFPHSVKTQIRVCDFIWYSSEWNDSFEEHFPLVLARFMFMATFSFFTCLPFSNEHLLRPTGFAQQLCKKDCTIVVYVLFISSDWSWPPCLLW